MRILIEVELDSHISHEEAEMIADGIADACYEVGESGEFDGSNRVIDVCTDVSPT